MSMKMNRNEIIEKLKEILLFADDSSNDKIDSIGAETHLQNDLGLTSVNMLYLIIATEEEFGIRFTDIGMNEFGTVGDVADYIERKLS